MANNGLFEIDTEVAVLSLILKNPELIHNIDGLRFYMFSSTPHQALFSEFEELLEKQLVPDPTLVYSSLESKNGLDNIGGKKYFESLLSREIKEESFEELVKNVVSSYKARSFLSVTSINRSKLTSSNIDEEIGRMRQSLDSLMEVGGYSSTIQLGEIAKDTYEEIISRTQSPGINGNTWGNSDIDKATGGKAGGDLWVIAARPGMGKCLGVGTKIVMYDGSIKKVEDIKSGDLLMGVDSTPRRVLSTTSGIEQMYWIRQKKGMDYRVNESHIISLKRSKNESNYFHGEICNVSVRDIINGNFIIGQRWKGYKVSVEFKDKLVPLDPYFLGLWLGDGKSTDDKIYNTDIEIIDYLREYANELNVDLKVGDLNRQCKYYQLHNIPNTVNKHLRSLELINNKHIPSLYLHNSTKKRMELLAGLIDSDGYNTTYGVYEITSKFHKLAIDIKYLADSLGFKVSIKEKKAKSQRGTESIVWRIYISGYVENIPVKVSRKKISSLVHRIDPTVTGISIEKDTIDTYYGFEIDGDKLFLLEDFTVTHNTAAIVNSIYADATNGIPSLLIQREMRSQQMLERLICIDTGIPNTNIRLGILNPTQIKQVYDSLAKLKKLPIYVDTSYKSSDPYYIESTVTRYKNKHGIENVYVDYIQLLTERDENQTQEIGRFTRLFKILSNQLNICSILASQLNRNLEYREDKRPLLSDMKQSGAIEEDSDFVVGLYRDEVYNKESKYKGLMEYIILKHRNGPPGTLTLGFDGPTNKIVEAK